MKHVHILQVIAEVFAFIGPENPQRKTNQGPHVDRLPGVAPNLGQVVNLGMAVVTWRDAVVGAGGQNLVGLDPSVSPALFLETRLEKPAPAAAAEVVGPVRGHVDKVFLSHYRFDHETQVLGNGVAVALSDDLTRILDGKLDFSVLVPIAVDLESALSNPLGIIFVDALDLEFVLDVELFQSGPD